MEGSTGVTSTGAILITLLRVMVVLFVVDCSKTPPLDSVTDTTKPSLNVTGGTTNQKALLSATVVPNSTGVLQTRVISFEASSDSTAEGMPSKGIVTVAFPASFSPFLPFSVMEDTETPSP